MSSIIQQKTKNRNKAKVFYKPTPESAPREARIVFKRDRTPPTPFKRFIRCEKQKIDKYTTMKYHTSKKAF